jgi:hypothetical protein
MYNLTFDNPYNRAIQKKMLELSQNQGWEPDRLDRKVGGCGMSCGGSKLRPSAEQQPSFFRTVPKSETFIQPATGPSYPQLNMDELASYNMLDLSKEKTVPFQGGLNFKKMLKPVGSVIRSKPVQNLLKEGATKAVESAVLGVSGNPILAKTVSTATKGLTDSAVEQTSKQIGKGGKKPRKPRSKKVAGVEEYRGGKLELLISKSEDVKVEKSPKKSGVDKKTKRAQLVKKVMNEKKMSLPQASKYIKENNLM